MTAYSEGLQGFQGKQTTAEQAESAATNHSSQVDSGQVGSGIGSTTGGSLDQEPVVVWEAANHMEAQIVKGRLESEEIPAFIRGEALGVIYGLTSGGLAATDVLVPAPLADKAIAILNTEVIWVNAEEDDDEEDGKGE